MPPDKTQLAALKIDREEVQRRPRFRVGWIVVSFLVIGSLAIWLSLQRTKTPEVHTALVRERVQPVVQTVLNASGYVTARRSATVSSKVTGKVTEVLIEEGMEVEEGQVLARLDTANVDTNLRLAEAQLTAVASALKETRVLLAQAKRDRARIESLVKERVSTQSALDQATAEVDALNARLERQGEEEAVARRQIEVWRQEKADREIRAPFRGVVVSKDAQPGEMISPVSAGGGFTRTGIGTIVDMDSLEIEVDVNESYINRVSPGQPVEATLDAYPDWRIPARVIAIVPTADRQKATVRVRIGFDRLDPHILPDMGVKVAFRENETGEPDTTTSIAVPKEAVRENGGQHIVYVVREGRLERRSIKPGAERGGELMILAGLAAGEKVMVDGPPRPKDGQAVLEVKD